jgi:hypothetical protein
MPSATHREKQKPGFRRAGYYSRRKSFFVEHPWFFGHDAGKHFNLDPLGSQTAMFVAETQPPVLGNQFFRKTIEAMLEHPHPQGVWYPP